MELAIGLAGYGLAQLPPYHGRPSGRASVLVLSCIDPRFTNDLAWFLSHNVELQGDYDLFVLAGAELGVFHSPTWKQTFREHVDIAIQLHGISQVWCFSHMDCGMYKITYGLDEDNDKELHRANMRELKAFLESDYPALGFKGHLISLQGVVNPA